MDDLKLLIISLEQSNNSGGWLKRNSHEIAQIEEDIQIVSVTDGRNSHILEKEKSLYGYIGGDNAGHGLKVIEPDRDTTISQVIRSQIRDYKPQYVILAADEEDCKAADISSALVALECFPRAVGASSSLLYRPPALLENLNTIDSAQPDRYIHSGREVARLLLLRAVEIPSLSNFVIRAAALGSDLPGDYDVQNGILFRRQLLIELLLRGSLWIEKQVVYTTGNQYGELDAIFGYLNSLKFALDNGVVKEWDIDLIIHNLALEVRQLDLGWQEESFVNNYLANVGSSVKKMTRPKYHSLSDEDETGTSSGNITKIDFKSVSTLSGSIQAQKKSALSDQAVNVMTPFNFLIFLDQNTIYTHEREQLLGLYRYLKRYGYDAKVFIQGDSTASHGGNRILQDQDITYALAADINENSVSIYSETANPHEIMTKYRVKWYFNRRRLAGQDDSQNLEIQYTYSRAIDPYFPVFKLPVYNLNDAISDFEDTSRKKKRLLLLGRGEVDPSLDRTSMLEVSDSWPVDLGELSVLGRDAMAMLSYDWMNPLNEKAILAGIPVILCGEQFWPNSDPMIYQDHLQDGMCYSPNGDISYEVLKSITDGCQSYRKKYQEDLDHVADLVNNLVSCINNYYTTQQSDNAYDRGLAKVSQLP